MNKVVKFGAVGCGLLVLGSLVVLLQRHEIKPKPTWKPVQIELKSRSAHANQYMAQVHIAGAVKHPGVYAVSPNLRLKEALELAGGVTAKANLDKINLAKHIKDGQKILIPSRKPVKKRAKTSGELISVSINSAGVSELVKVKGIGPKMAARIIEYRNKHGAFRSLKDLENVKGIGPKTLAKLQPNIRL